MKEIKRYTSIVRYGKSSTRGVIKEGDIISITEKIDGSSVSFTKDDDNFLGVTCFSRRQTLTPEDTLLGYYGWIRENVAPIKDRLNPNYRYMGEWTLPRKVKYKEEYTKQFFLFSIWDEETEQYLNDGIVRAEAFRLGLQTVEYFYYGEFISYEHISSFVGKSNITEIPDTGEGIVVKNVNYRNKAGDQVFVKIVTEAFAEMQSQRLPKNPNIFDTETGIIRSVLTKPRVDKMMLNLVDEGLLTREEFSLENMIKLIKLLMPRIKEDLYKEESETLEQLEEKLVNKVIGRVLPVIIREVVKEYETELTNN
ncbi:MAG: RNA ligase family protein [Sarcina sp.]